MLEIERKWVTAILQTFTVGFEDDANEVDLAGCFERVRLGSPPLARFGMRATLLFFATWPSWHGGHGMTVSDIPLAGRVTLVRGWLDHRLVVVRKLATLFKVTACFALFSNPRVRAMSKYAPVVSPSGIAVGPLRRVSNEPRALEASR